MSLDANVQIIIDGINAQLKNELKSYIGESINDNQIELTKKALIDLLDKWMEPRYEINIIDSEEDRNNNIIRFDLTIYDAVRTKE